MALDVYFREDILNVLRSVYVASEGVVHLLEDPGLGDVAHDELLSVYRLGFVTALGSVGLAFGLERQVLLRGSSDERGYVIGEPS